MPTSAVNGALVTCCSYCCGDLLVEDGGDAACRYCGNLVYVHATPPPPIADAGRRVGSVMSPLTIGSTRTLPVLSPQL
jgi:hypothetical protein